MCQFEAAAWGRGALRDSGPSGCEGDYAEPGKQMYMFERKRGAGNEHAGSKGILGREELKLADAMSLFLWRFEVWLLVTNFG